MESRNIKIASRIIDFCSFVIRYVGFRDVVISIYAKKKEKYAEDLIYYCWIVEEKYWISSILYRLAEKRHDFQSRYGILNLFPPKGHSWSLFPINYIILWGESHFSCFMRLFIFLQLGTLRDTYTNTLALYRIYSNSVTICTKYIYFLPILSKINSPDSQISLYN